MNRESSSLSPPTIYVRGCANLREWLSGRASPCQGESHGFDPRLPLQVYLSLNEHAYHDYYRLCVFAQGYYALLIWLRVVNWERSPLNTSHLKRALGIIKVL